MSQIPGPATSRWWTVAAAVEVVLAAVAVVADVLIPTFVLLAMAGASLAARRQGPGSLGLRRPRGGVGRTAAQAFGLTVGWTVVQLALFMPVLEHLTGRRQDLSDFDTIHGNLPMLLVYLGLSWTLAAVGEEVAYRGYLLTRLREVLPPGTVGVALAVAGSSVLFGLAHTEQGVIGIALTTLDAIFFCWLRYRFASLWACVLAHGFNNTIGLIAYYLVGPVYGLW